ncbi:MAG: C4-dicarboxylate-binding periplasmic protein precursor [Candidatus Accumulibacter appositus]|uniref:C4-dicarboxylate-binding periplasmic protein n=1 Tax=Candidatus Accumulibacter appositus TaxID=1454003 RepID=A0A011PVQ9_9PROT|nr:TRAP transporter substrate-binding protein [Accumulibacter sp.]EXI81137.1 MAG: C4-dicarboxylate-binding periplasmic protein precursor [Candidatus Accumulibacter appositus]HRF04618.1 TRAP transporter substrate-binding protein [Accumulibacter sp.]
MTTRSLLLALLALVISTMSLSAQAEDPIVIKFSHVVAPDTPKGLGAEFFAKRAAERTNGRVKVEVYPNSTLYKDKEELEALQLGAVQMVAPSLAKFSLLGVREFELYDLPYIFDSYAELHKVTQGPIGKSLFRKLEPKGIVGLAYWDNGFKSFSANAPIFVPADLKGKKMRIQPSKVLEAQMLALDAIPRVMAFSEVYQALKIGVVDGTENPISNLYTQKMFEVQSHLTMTEHGYLGYVVIVDKKFWEALPADVRGQLDLAMKDATDYTNQIAKQQNDQDLESVRRSGKTRIHVPTPEQRRAFKKALIPVHQEMAPRIGEDLLQSVYSETGFDPGAL